MTKLIVGKTREWSCDRLSRGLAITIRTPIPSGATDLGIRYTGARDLIILETEFH